LTPNLVAFLLDATVAFREVIELSVAHIYLSALPFEPTTSKIAQVFKAKYPYMSSITAQGVQHEQKPLLDLRGHASYVRSVGFSPDGTRIATGTSDKTIRYGMQGQVRRP